MKFFSAFLFVFMFAAQANALTPEYLWENVNGATSAQLAEKEWVLVSSSAVTLAEGKTAIITFWRKHNDKKEKDVTVRCTDYKDKTFKDNGSICAVPTINKL